MSAESVTDLVRSLVAAVAQEAAAPAAVAALLRDAGYENPDEHVTKLAAGRHGAYLPLRREAELSLAGVQRIYGPGRRQLALDSDGPTEWTWDIAVGGNQHVVLTAEVDDHENSVRQLMFTPYSL
ncbi:MAG: hypothetical protein QOH57_3574 [Mycobacterium sp.]|jgi:hypothetical protein|nr:hypothetical protein [Mycobacterium sp.]